MTPRETAEKFLQFHFRRKVHGSRIVELDDGTKIHLFRAEPRPNAPAIRIQVLVHPNGDAEDPIRISSSARKKLGHKVGSGCRRRRRRNTSKEQQK